MLEPIENDPLDELDESTRAQLRLACLEVEQELKQKIPRGPEPETSRRIAESLATPEWQAFDRVWRCYVVGGLKAIRLKEMVG